MIALEILPKVGPTVADALRAAGFTFVEDVAAADLDALVAVKGIGHATARTIADAATQLVSDESEESPTASEVIGAAEVIEEASETGLSDVERARIAERLKWVKKAAKKARRKSKNTSGRKRKNLRTKAKKHEKLARKLKKRLS